jgi:hypothetical protein
VASSVSTLIFTILGIDKGSPALDKVADSADRTTTRLDRMGNVGLKVLPALSIAATGSATVVGGALGSMTMMMGGLGVAAAASVGEVQDEYKGLASTVVDEVKGMAAPMVPALTNIAEKTTAAFKQMAPQIDAAIEDSAGHIETLADGVLGFALTAMPGMTKAVDRAGPVMEGWKRLLISTGQGVGEFFSEVSEGSDEAGAALEDVGSIINNTLGFAGRWFNMLVTEGAPAVDRFASVTEKALDIVGDLGEGGFPVLFGAAGAALDVLNGVLTVLGPIATEGGTVLGVVLSVAAALRLMRAAGNWGTGVAQQFATIRKAADEAGDRTGVARSRLSAMAGMLGGPWGMAVALGGALLMGFGQKQQESEARVKSWTDALRESNGAITENMRLTKIKEMQDNGVLAVASKLGVSTKLVTDAYMGNANALAELNRLAERNRQIESDSAGDKLNNLGANIELGNSWDVLIDKVSQGNHEVGQGTAAYKALDEAMGDTTSSTNAATEASKRRRQAMADERMQVLAAINAEFALEAALRGIESAQYSAEEATEAYNDAVKQHGVRSREAREADLQRRDALGQLDDSVMQALAAAGQYAVETSRVTEEADKNRVSTEAMNRKALEMASTWNGPLPDALRKTVGSMSQAELAANGVTVKVNKMGQAVYSLPNGKTITLDAKDSKALAAIRAVQKELAAVERHVAINIKVNQDGRVPAIANRPTMKARGGPVKAMKMYEVGEEGRELFVPGEDGYIIPADQTRRLLANTGTGPRSGPVVTTGGSGGGTHVENLHIHALQRPFTLDEIERGLAHHGAL